MIEHKEKASTYMFSNLTEFKFLDEEKGIFSGYGSTFDNVDAHGDTIAPGAYKETLKYWKKRGKYPKMLVQHGFSETGLPVGKWTRMEEDDKGLKVEGQLFPPETELLTHIRIAMKAGELDGLSIGYKAIDVQWPKIGENFRRKLKSIDLFEVSIVTFPADANSRVQTIKASDIKTRRDFERMLRDSGMFSKQDAVRMASAWDPSKLSDSASGFEFLKDNIFKG